MRGGRVGKLIGLAAIAAAAAAALKALRGDPVPQFSNHPSVDGGPLPKPLTLDPEPLTADWVEPIDGACPDGYPIKAKLASGIFHQPGGLSYERTNPDRCYATVEAAEADGLRASKR